MISRRELWKSKKRIAMDATINISGGSAVDTWTTECLGTALMGEGKTTTTLFTNHYQRRRKKNKINMKTIKESIEYNLQRANEILGTNYRNWRALSRHNGLTEDFIREFANEVDWCWISTYQNLSEDFIREFADKVDVFYISRYQYLSEGFIREFAHKVDWFCISKYQHLSEGFIREFKDKVDWFCISKYQYLSEDFIREFKDRVNWYFISECQHLSKEFIDEFKYLLNENVIADSWHYKSTEEKKKAVMDTGLYECHEDYFIAYKGIRADRYSKFNFHYQYLKGHTYETWCDCSDDEYSFGFSAWTEKGARNYCDELIVRVKIRYEDVGRVVHNGGKIRCFKIEILD